MGLDCRWSHNEALPEKKVVFKRGGLFNEVVIRGVTTVFTLRLTKCSKSIDSKSADD